MTASRRNTNAQTDHSRRLRQDTAAAHRAARIAAGWRQVSVLLPPETLAALETARHRHGTLAAAIAAALEAMERLLALDRERHEKT